MNKKLLLNFQSPQESDQDLKQLQNNSTIESKPLQELNGNINSKANNSISINRKISDNYESKTIQSNRFFHNNQKEQNIHEYDQEIIVNRQKKLVQISLSQNKQDANKNSSVTKLKSLKLLKSIKQKQFNTKSVQKIKSQQFLDREEVQSSKKMLYFQVQDENTMEQASNQNQNNSDQSDQCSLQQTSQKHNQIQQNNQGTQHKINFSQDIINQIVYNKKLPEKKQNQSQEQSDKQQELTNQNKSIQTNNISNNVNYIQEVQQLKKRCFHELNTGRPTKQLKLKLRDFFLNEYKPSDNLQLKITRKKDLLNFFTPQFHMQFLREKNFVMACKKTLSKPISTFLFSSSKQNFNQNSLSYLGKMKSNITGSILNIFGTGYNPQMANCLQNSPRQLLATIQFHSQSFGIRRPRQFTVYLKNKQFDYYKDFAGVTIYQDQIPLNQLYLIPQNKNKITVFRTRKPKYCEKVGGYILNFQGKVKCPSIKNFILQEVGKQGKNVILFGKISDNEFIVQISNPLPPIVGLGVALSSFDSRLGSQ